MSNDRSGPRSGRPGDLRGAIRAVEPTDRGLEVTVRLQNAGSRALHYIADVRAISYDPDTRRLLVRLSDEGRVLIPGAASKLPEFRHVDPGGEAELRLRVPRSVVKLAATDTPTREVRLETQRPAEATDIEVAIAWADVPYYEDARSAEDRRLPSVRWQQHTLRIGRDTSG